jgi:predicted nucleic acid-binding protein
LKLYVLDASVAAKWYLHAPDETFLEEALHFQRLYATAEVELLVPDIFYSEFASVFRKAERRGRCDAATADQAIAEILGREFPSFPATAVLQQAVAISRQHGCSIYDSIYLALATEFDAPFVTADEKLRIAVGGRLPLLWLGAFGS